MHSLIPWIPWLIVVAASFEVSFRRSRNLSRNSQWAAPAQKRAARRRALWPAFCAIILLLPLLTVFNHVEDKLVSSATSGLMMLSVSFFSGWFIGVIAGMDPH